MGWYCLLVGQWSAPSLRIRLVFKQYNPRLLGLDYLDGQTGTVVTYHSQTNLWTSEIPQWIKRPCLNELLKEYCVKIKLTALDWQWVTLISWCQMNRHGQSSPVMHNVEGQTHKHLEKLKIMSKKYTYFWHFWWSIFRSPELTYVFLLKKMIIPLYFTHVWLCVDLVSALLLAIWRISLVSVVFFHYCDSHDYMKMLLNT